MAATPVQWGWRYLFSLCLVAEAHGKLGHPGRGLQLLSAAMADRKIESFHEPELHRLTGELLLAEAAAASPEAEECFRRAIEIAGERKAKSLELRAVTSLSRLFDRQGKHEDARRMLAGTYGWFTEGFDTADLKDAKALLDALGH